MHEQVMDAIQPPMSLEEAVEWIEDLIEQLEDTSQLLRADISRRRVPPT